MKNKALNSYYVLEANIDPPILPGHDYVSFYVNLSSKYQVDKVLEILKNNEFDVFWPCLFEKNSLNEYKEEDFLNDYDNSKLKFHLNLDGINTNKCFFTSDSDEMIKWTEAKLPLVDD